MKIKKHKKKHALFSPSNAEKWFNCSASLGMEIGLKEIKSTKYSKEGSIAHKIAEKVLKNKLYNLNNKKLKKKINAFNYINTRPLLFSTKKENNLVINETMAKHIQIYIDKVWKMSKNNFLFIEQKVNFSKVIGISNQFGTADAIVIKKTEIQVHDFKYGFVKVNAKNNKQMQLYALGAIQKNNFKNNVFKKIRLCIHQPRLNYFSEWMLDLDELLFFGKKAKLAAQHSLLAIDIVNSKGINFLDKKMFSPGIKQCKWCKAAGGKCKEEVLYNLKIITGKKLSNVNDYKLDNLKNKVNTLKLKELSFIYSKLKTINNFIYSIKNRVLFELNAGTTIPGIKLVCVKNKIKKWKNETLVEKILKEYFSYQEIYTMKLINPSKAEKIISKKFPYIWKELQSFIIKNEKKIKIIIK